MENTSTLFDIVQPTDTPSIKQQRVKKETFTFGNCKICQDKATGVHYGITTCEGCKGFYKRNIQRSTYYQCFFGRNCDITPRTRNRCKACRFKRCIEVGMSFDGIKMGRIPKAVKKLALEVMDLNNNTSEKIDSERITQMSLCSSSNEANEGSLNPSPIQEHSPNNYSENLLEYDHCVETKHHRSSSSLDTSMSSDSGTSSSRDTSFRDTSQAVYAEMFEKRDLFELNVNSNEHLYSKSRNMNCEPKIASPLAMQPSLISAGGKVDPYNQQFVIENADSIQTYFEEPAERIDSTQNFKETTLCQFLKSINSTKSRLFNSHSNSPPPQALKPVQYNFQNSYNIKTDSPTNQQQLTLTNPLSVFLSRQHALRSSNLFLETNFLQLYMSKTSTDSTFQIVCSVLNDKILQVVNNYLEKSTMIYKRVLKCLKRMEEEGDAYVQEADFEFHNGTTETIWDGLINSLPEYVMQTFYFCKELPGINELDQKDFSEILNNKLYEIFILVHAKFFINGESYLRLANNVHYSRMWMTKVKGMRKTMATFELAETLQGFEMTEKERAILLPLIITMPENDEELRLLGDLNECYTCAILYEFDLNKRDDAYILKLSKIIQKLKESKVIEHSTD